MAANNQPSLQPFEIGFTLTGSVSAGAYTAGVIDFLIEALDNWDKAKQQNQAQFGADYSQWTTPWLNVVIKGLSGASGGGVTCGMILNAIGREIDPVPQPVSGNALNNDFYNAWVNGIGIDQLTQTDDLADGSCRSILDGNTIPGIAGNILQQGNFGNVLFRDYMAENLRAVITITNLRGIPYFLKNKGIGANQLVYYRNADFVKFELDRHNQPASTADVVSIPYDTTDPRFAPGYAKLKAACLATCAFPAAFPAQQITQDTAMYFQRPNSKSLALAPGQPYTFLNSDGGICNTNPFELLHADMLPPNETQNPRNGTDVKRSIIIIAPLDTDMNVAAYDVSQDSLPTIITQVVGAIRNEAEFTDEQIALALDDCILSRFIIAPVRYDASGTQVQTPAITGTTLGNFGAFLSQDFRQHDFFLGRMNAQLFLKKHFAIPYLEIIQNPIFIPLDIANNRVKFQNQIFTDPDTNVEYFSIIPLEGSAANNLYNPPWPTGQYDIDKIQGEISTRLDGFITNAVNALASNWFIRVVLWPVKAIVQSQAIKFLIKTIGDGLSKANL